MSAGDGLTRSELTSWLEIDEGLAADVAEDLADQFLLADSDVQGAIERWVHTGTMPDQPVVDGVSPAQLARTGQFLPSQVFAAMMMLRTDPTMGREFLKHPPPKS